MFDFLLLTSVKANFQCFQILKLLKDVLILSGGGGGGQIQIIDF